jgi:hypothetical protein
MPCFLYAFITWRTCSLAIVHSAAVNMGVQVSVLYPDLHSFRYMPKSCILDHVMVHFKPPYSFHSDCTNLHSHQHYIFLFPLHPYRHLPSFVFLMIPILTEISVFWFAFSLQLGMLNISWSIFWPFVLLSRSVCSIHLPINWVVGSFGI